MILRGVVIYNIAQEAAGCTLGMAATAVQQDASILGLICALTGCTYLARRYWLQLPLLVFSIILLLSYAIDTLITQALIQRLYLFDLLKFGKELNGIFRFIEVFLTTKKGEISLVFTIIAVVILTPTLLPRSYRPHLAIGYFIVAVVLALVGQWRPVTTQYIHYDLLQNFIAANLDLGTDRPYSKAYAERIVAEYTPSKATCLPGQSQHPNIIILAVESLSMYHSMLFGGMRNLTPHLDTIARDHTWFSNFIANGFTTDMGLIAMITGRPPIPAIGRYQSIDAFGGFADPQGALPDLLRPAGYSTRFFTTGDLGFLDKTSWLKALHFDGWEGAEQPFYNGWKRYLFNAAEDKALYQRVLQWLDQRDSEQPFMAFLLTVSTHPPFINPRNDQSDEEGAFRYADDQIGLFYDELKNRGFFNNGILLITGDHRSMTPLHTAEQTRFGDSALARVPFVMVTDLPLIRSRVSNLFQQTDIPSSLADLTQTRACRTPAQGTFLSTMPLPASYALHVRGDRRNEIDVFFNNQQAQIVLDGDRSHWSGPKPVEWRTIFDDIILDRIKRGALTENWIDIMLKLRTPQPIKVPEAPASAHP
jgi:arylsulfatase A-like enzyme